MNHDTNEPFVLVPLKTVEMLPEITLDERLASIANHGFINVNGCFILKDCLADSTHARREDFTDEVGYECFINHLHLDDFVSTNSIQQAIMLIAKVFLLWTHDHGDKILNAITSCDDQFVTVRFHVERHGQEWLAADLDGYEEGVFEVSSRDPNFPALLGLP